MPQSTNNSECLMLLKQHPLFALISNEVLQELAESAQRCEFRQGEIIVQEEEWVDAVYFIATGRADVYHKTEQTEMDTLPIATLGPGEAIGLSKLGIYSTTGLRTATVKARVDIIAYRLFLKEIEQIFDAFPQVTAQIQLQAKVLLRMQFIKQLKPFEDLSLSQLKFLAESLKVRAYPSATIIFQQGSVSDECYFVAEGQVAIISENAEQDDPLALLEKGTIFGETGIILKLPRNATAKAMTDCVLFSIDAATLHQVIQPESTPPKLMIKLLQSRCRPKASTEIEIYPRQTAEGEDIYLLQHKRTLEIYELSAEALILWQQLDGNRPLEKLVADFINRFPEVNAQDAVALVIDLANAGFVDIEGFQPAWHQTLEHLPWWLRILKFIPRIAEVFITNNNIDGFISNTYRYVKWYFNPIVQIVTFLLLVLGLIAFFMESKTAIHHLSQLPLSNFWWVYLTFFSSLFIHEFTHAYLTKHFGYRVRAMGFGFFWFGPAAFCDTTDSLLAPRLQRLAINLVGVYTEASLAGLGCLLAASFSHIPLFALAWLNALFVYVNIVGNLDPVIDLDGYYTLQDLTGEPDLREKSVYLLTNHFWQRLKEEHLWEKHRPEMIFLTYTVIFHLALFPMLIWLQRSVLVSIFPFFASFLVTLLLTLLVITLSFFSVWGALKAKNINSVES